ncbi:MAG: D-glycerate dehydrogenase [Patescibacteria group bacterium]
MSKQIYITRIIPEIAEKMLREKGYEVDIYPEDRIPKKQEIIQALKNKQYDAVISLLTDKIDSEVFDSAPTVKIYANYAVGFDNIDVAEARKRNIVVTNTAGNYSFCIAEHAMALILGLATRIVEADDFVRKGKYKGWAPMNFIGHDIKGMKIGLIGAGKIGAEMARIASRGFDMKVIYHDVNRNENIERKYGAQYLETIEDVLKQADVVTLHVPLLDSTYHLINEIRLKMMKPSSYLINTSRGPVVDENALVKALQDGVIKGAGLDVFEFEPKLAKGLSDLPNVILTPHIASASEETRNEMARIVAQNVIDFLETGKATATVN